MKRITIYYFVLTTMLFLHCCNRKTTAAMSKQEEPVILEGKIIIEIFTNKIGRPDPRIHEFYLLTKDKSYFVKFTNESGIKKEDLDKIIDKNRKFKVFLRNGAWDADSPHVQSRYGEYVVILEIME